MKENVFGIVLLGLICLMISNMFSAFVVAWLTPATFWAVVFWMTVVEAVAATIQITYGLVRSKFS